MANRWGNMWEILFSWAPKSLQMVTAAMKLKDACSLEEKLGRKDQPREHIKKQRHYFAKIHLAKAMVFLVVMYGYESWTIKRAERWRIDAFELWCWRRLLRVPWTARRSNQSILKEISPEYSSERTDAEAETPILWPSDAKNWLIGKDPAAEKKWSQEKKGMTEDEMVGWHHWLNGHGFEQTPGDGDGQGSWACCSPWDHKESDMNWATELNFETYRKVAKIVQRVSIYSSPRLVQC